MSMGGSVDFVGCAECQSCNHEEYAFVTVNWGFVPDTFNPGEYAETGCTREEAIQYGVQEARRLARYYLRMNHDCEKIFTWVRYQGARTY